MIENQLMKGQSEEGDDEEENSENDAEAYQRAIDEEVDDTESNVSNSAML